MAKRDYYEVLEVDKTATLDVIKKAYRKKAIQYHPGAFIRVAQHIISFGSFLEFFFLFFISRILVRMIVSLCSVTSSVDMEEVSEALEVSVVADVPHNASSVVQTSV